MIPWGLVVVCLYLSLSAVRGQEYCLTRDGVQYCENNCCGPYDDQQCCSFNPTLLVLLVVAAILIILVVVILVLFCCKAQKKQRTTVVQPAAQPAVQYIPADHESRRSSITYVVVPPGESQLFLHNASRLPPYTPEPPKYSEGSSYASGTGPLLRPGHLNSVWPIPMASGSGNGKVASAPPSYASNHTPISVEHDMSSTSETPVKQESHM
ncbi:uncharacterized protein [Argopecten irradians]|uniref:uncharacterized protein n=1 Tax=Argopecten irradians TaxID=31199 RepID=UPI003717F2D4